MMYTIKPLRWRLTASDHTVTAERWEAKTFDRSYIVEKQARVYSDGFTHAVFLPSASAGWGKWVECKSVEAGKELASKHWEGLIKKALKKVSTS